MMHPPLMLFLSTFFSLPHDALHSSPVSGCLLQWDPHLLKPLNMLQVAQNRPHGSFMLFKRVSLPSGEHAHV